VAVTDWSEERPTFELVKATVTVPEVAQLLGFEVEAGDKIASPWNPEERTPSCHLYEDHWWDYSTGKGGDVVDLVRAFDPEMSSSQALSKIWNRALRAGREPGDVEREPVRTLEDFTELFERGELNQWVFEQQLGVTIPDETTRANHHELWIAHAEPERIYGVKVRSRSGAKSSWPGSQFTHRLYSPVGWELLAGATSCVICEGESDSWAMWHELGHLADVFALPSGAGSWKDFWMEDLERYTDVWLCMDNDHAGEHALEKLTRKIGHGKARTLRVPQLMKDARQAIAAGWKPLDAVSQ
jgi:hypothetical protein